MYTKKSNGPRIEPWGTPASTFVHVEYWPLRTTLWNDTFNTPSFLTISDYDGLQQNLELH